MPVIDSSLIPVSIAQEIIQKASEQSVVLQLGRRQPMPTAQVNVPFLKTLPASGWVNGIGGAKPQTTVEWSSSTITTEEVAAVVAVPQASIDDAGIPIWANVQQAIVDSISYSIDAAVLFGTGAPPSFPVGGIYGVGIAAPHLKVVHTATTDPPDLAQAASAAEGDVEDWGILSTGYAADVSMKSQLRGLRDVNGQPIFVPNLGADTYNSLYGDPVYFSGTAAFDSTKCSIIAGAWDLLIVGVRQDITVDTSTEGVITDASGVVLVNAFQHDQVLMRVFMRLGYVVGQPVSRYTGQPVFPFGFAKGAPRPTSAILVGDGEGGVVAADEASGGVSGGRTSKAS